MSTESPWSARAASYIISQVHRSGSDLDKLIHVLRPQAGDVVLDVGTGAGHTAARLAGFAHKVYGLDPSEGMLAAAQQSYGHLENLDFAYGFSNALPFEADSFDIMTARHTLHHHPSVPAFLSEAKRTLKTGGRLGIIDEITPHPELDTWYDRLERLRDDSHVRAYHVEEWQAFIAESGLDWIVGDSQITLRLDCEDWIMRTCKEADKQEAVREMFLSAPSLAKDMLNIQIQDGQAKSFDMPFLLLLAVKP